MDPYPRIPSPRGQAPRPAPSSEPHHCPPQRPRPHCCHPRSFLFLGHYLRVPGPASRCGCRTRRGKPLVGTASTTCDPKTPDLLSRPARLYAPNPGQPGAASVAQGPKMTKDTPPPRIKRPRSKPGANSLLLGLSLGGGVGVWAGEGERAALSGGRCQGAAACAAPRALRRSPEPRFSGAGRGKDVSGRS